MEERGASVWWFLWSPEGGLTGKRVCVCVCVRVNCFGDSNLLEAQSLHWCGGGMSLEGDTHVCEGLCRCMYRLGICVYM